jgi:hypothetical protein
LLPKILFKRPEENEREDTQFGGHSLAHVRNGVRGRTFALRSVGERLHMASP